MALIERQNPTTPNLVDSDLIYVVSSNNGSEPQFQFVAKIIDKDNNSVIVKQEPSPAGSLVLAKGVFNISQIAKDFMGEDKIWKTQKIAKNASANEFNVIFYEETGSSVSSSVSLQNPLSGSFVYLLDGVVEMNSGDWNWQSGSYYQTPLASTGSVFEYQHALTEAPFTQSIREGEYATLSFINGNFDGSTTNAQDIFNIQFTFYDEDGVGLGGFDYKNIVSNGGGPRTVSTQLWNAVAGLQTDSSKMIHIGTGIANLTDAGFTIPSGWASYSVHVEGQDDAGLNNSFGQYSKRWYVKQEPECDYEGTRFAWLNELGAWDYYTFPYAISISDTITRQTYQQGFVNYSNNTAYTVPYDVNRRGTRQYSTQYEEVRSAESDWLSQEEADWLRQLVESPNVYVQVGTTDPGTYRNPEEAQFMPVVIETTNFDYKTNPRTDKMYRLSLSYKFANNRRSR